MNITNQWLIVGYKGEIGSFLLNGLLRVLPKALDILCFDINETEEEKVNRIKSADIIFLCVPLKETVVWIRKYKDLLKGKIILEQCSLKEWIFEVEEIKSLDIRSMHILFRPSQTPNIQDRKIGLFKGQFNRKLEKLIADISKAKVVWFKNAKEHDREMAIQQALLHRTILVLGKLFDKCNGSTYVSKKILELRDRICCGNKELYSDIQNNKHLSEQIKVFQKELNNFDINKFWKG